jgi:peptide-methionine (R)-S-oxide reductase
MSEKPEKLIRTEEEWREILTPEQYAIIRQGGTERPFTGEYNHNKEKGTYNCAGCGQPLFSSDTKYDSGSGWPSFWDVLQENSLEVLHDTSYGMSRLEIKCARCGSHLGHLFEDGPRETTGQRYCVNSASLKFEKGE